MRRDAPSETGAVLIVLPGDKGFHLFQVRLLHTCHLSDFMNPVPLQFLCSGLVVHVGKGQAV